MCSNDIISSILAISDKNLVFIRGGVSLIMHEYILFQIKDNSVMDGEVVS